MVLSHAAKAALKIAAKKLAIAKAHRIKKTAQPRVRKTAKPRVKQRVKRKAVVEAKRTAKWQKHDKAVFDRVKTRVGKAVDSAVLYPFARERTKREVKKLRRLDIDTMGSIRKDRKLSSHDIAFAQKAKLRMPGYYADKASYTAFLKTQKFGRERDIKALYEEPGKKYILGGGVLGLPIVSLGHPDSALYIGDKTKKPKPKDKESGRR